MSHAAENFLRRHLFKPRPEAGGVPAPGGPSFSGFGLPVPTDNAPVTASGTTGDGAGPAEGGQADAPLDVDLGTLDLDLGLCEPPADAPLRAPRVDLDLPLETVPAILWRSDLDGPSGADAAVDLSSGPVEVDRSPVTKILHEPAALNCPGLTEALESARAAARLVAVLHVGSPRLDEVAPALGDGETVARAEIDRRVREVIDAFEQPGEAPKPHWHRDGADGWLVLPGLSTALLAEQLARRCLEALARPMQIGPRRLALTGAVGIAIFPHDGIQATGLQRAARVAARHAARPGRSGYQFYAQEMESRSLQRLDLDAELRDALAQGQLQLQFQPRLSLRNQALDGADVELVWASRDGQRRDSRELLALADELGLAEPLAQWLVHRACEQLEAWVADGLGQRRLTLPVLPAALRRGAAIERLHEILYEHGMPPGAVVLRLTPPNTGGTSSLLDTERPQDLRDWALRLDPLRDAGYGLCLDASACSALQLARLGSLPLTGWRVDAALLDSLDGASGTLTHALIETGRRRGLAVSVAGVRSEAQLERLRRDGAEHIVGDLLSEPLDDETWRELLRGARPLTRAGALGGPVVAADPAAASPAEDVCDIPLHTSPGLAA